jgi:hypothetical protein
MSRTRKIRKKLYKNHLSNEIKILFLQKTRIYPKWFPKASTVIWSLVLQKRNLMNKIEEFWKCDDFSGEIRSLTDKNSESVMILVVR